MRMVLASSAACYTTFIILSMTLCDLCARMIGDRLSILTQLASLFPLPFSFFSLFSSLVSSLLSSLLSLPPPAPTHRISLRYGPVDKYIYAIAATQYFGPAAQDASGKMVQFNYSTATIPEVIAAFNAGADANVEMTYDFVKFAKAIGVKTAGYVTFRLGFSCIPPFWLCFEI